ncbi:MAG: ATP-binding protein [Bacteroidetes bacterium]|nr:ATP-binding protein [Bacteroidota bacterium]
MVMVSKESTLYKLIHQVPPISPDVLGEELMKYFERYKTQSLVVVENDKPIGFLSYKKTADALSSQFGFALYQKRPVTELMLREFLIVKSDSSFHDVVQWALARKQDSIYEDIVVVENEKYVGLISIDRVLMEQRVRLLKHAEELEISRNKLAAVNAQLQQALKELKTREDQLLQTEKMASIGTLTSGIAHDFNNMLSVILSGVHLLRKNLNSDSPLNQYCDIIENAGKRSANLVRQLLDFSQKNILNKKIVCLNDVILETTHILERSLAKEIHVEMGLDAFLEDVEADETQLQQVIMNLALNARDAMPTGGTIRITTSMTHLDHTTKKVPPSLKPGKYVVMKIEDTGTGIPPEILPKIFEPFFTTKPVGKGTGLGLAVVYGIVTRHKGHIEVMSTVGKGTTFTIYLPAYERKGERNTVQTKKAEINKGTGTILLVDDEDMVLQVTRDLLQSQGYTVLSARNGTEAIELYRQHASTIDLVILDMVMPGKNGKDTFYDLRNINRTVKVLIVTGYVNEDATQSVLRDGALAIVQKPIDYAEFSHIVRESIAA